MLSSFVRLHFIYYLYTKYTTGLASLKMGFIFSFVCKEDAVIDAFCSVTLSFPKLLIG